MNTNPAAHTPLKEGGIGAIAYFVCELFVQMQEFGLLYQRGVVLYFGVPRSVEAENQIAH
jgi:hypothetical protein